MKATETIKYLTKVIFVVGMFIHFSTQAKIIYVDHTATGNSNGSSWTNADTSIKHAVTASAAKDTIMIAKGKYKEGGEIVIDKALTLIGGYDNGGSALPSKTNITQISGENSYRIIKTVNTQGTYIYFKHLEFIEGRHSEKGAGIFNDGAALSFVNCTIRNNQIISSSKGANTPLYGAGIYALKGSLYLDTSSIKDNKITRDFGTRWNAVNNFINYTSWYHGAGIYSNQAAVGIYNSSITGNQIKYSAISAAWFLRNKTRNTIFGVAVSVSNKSLSITNSNVSGNTVSFYNQLYCNSSSTATTEINSITEVKGGTIFSENGNTTINNSTFNSNGVYVSTNPNGSDLGSVSQVYNTSNVYGGVIHSDNGVLSINNSHLNGNVVSFSNGNTVTKTHHEIDRQTKFYGGVIYATGSGLNITNSEIKSNNNKITNRNSVISPAVASNKSISYIYGNVLNNNTNSFNIINTTVQSNRIETNKWNADPNYRTEFSAQILSNGDLNLTNSILSKNNVVLGSKNNYLFAFAINTSGKFNLISSTIAANSANKFSSITDEAIYCSNKFTCYNSIISHNKNSGKELNVGLTTSRDIKFSFIRTQNYSGTGNFNGTGNPGFIDSNSNYNLNANSMLLNKGDSSLSSSIQSDLNDDKRVVACNIDLGCYEYQSFYNSPIVDKEICEKESAILIGKGENIKWYEDINLSNLLFSGDTFNTNKTNPKTHVFHYTDAIKNCPTIQDSVMLIIHALPTVELGLDTSFCKGDSITLSAGTFSKHWWSNGDSLQTTTINSAGEYWLQVENSKGCLNKDSIIILENDLPKPFLGNDTVYCDTTKFITLNPGSYKTYKWQNSSTDSFFIVTPSFLGLGAHTFKVNVEDKNGCKNSDIIVLTFEKCKTALNDIKGISIDIYPNPAKDHITIESNFNSLSNVQIIDATGKVILSKSSMHVTSLDLDISGYSKGLYIIKAVCNGKVASFKMIKH